MNKYITSLLILLTLTILASARPCARCYGEGTYCGRNSGGQCVGGTKCASLINSANTPVCLPTVSAGDACEGLAYDPCPSRHYCHDDLKTCQLNPGIAKINDGCTTDEACEGRLKCSNGICTNTDNDNCNVVGCPVHQTCNDPILNPTCINKGTVNSQCVTSNDCWMSTCIGGTCRELFSAVENGDCESLYDCELGLQCTLRLPVLEQKCYKPILHYLDAAGTKRWGPECDATKATGCTCDHGAGVERLLIEQNPVVKTECKDALIKYYECLANNNCYQADTFENSCVRANCNPERVTFENQCQFFGFPPVRCAASGLMMALIFIIAVLLL